MGATDRRVAVPQHKEAAGIKLPKTLGIAGDKFALCVGDRQIELLNPAEENAFVVYDSKVHPSVLEPAGVVPSQRGRYTHFVLRRDQKPGLEQHLETVTNPQNQAVLLTEIRKRLPQVNPQLGGQDAAGSNVVAVAKPPGIHKI